MPKYERVGDRPSHSLGVERPRTRNAAFARVLARLERFARDGTAPILLEGESGTGKTSIARYVHDASPRGANTFLSVSLSSLDDALVSSELFGHVAGAFTDARAGRAGVFVSANGGTLFLDEIGKASSIVQHRLLNVIECGQLRPVGSDRDVPIDVRIIAASNVDLESLVDMKAFLPDLYARLENFRVQIPPVRERRADIPDLVDASLRRYAPRCGYTGVPTVDEGLMEVLRRAPWPNNIRQLDATVHRLLIEADGATQLTLALCNDDLAHLRDPRATADVDLTEERIKMALARSAAKTDAAKLLGVHRTTLWRHLKGRPPSATPA